KVEVLCGLEKFDEARPLLEKLPESTPSEILRKAQLAQMARLTGLADGLLTKLSNDEIESGATNYPGTFQLAVMMVNSHRREEAIKLVHAAMDKNPTSKLLDRMLKNLEGTDTPE